MCTQERQWCVGWVGNLGVEDSGPKLPRCSALWTKPDSCFWELQFHSGHWMCCQAGAPNRPRSQAWQGLQRTWKCSWILQPLKDHVWVGKEEREKPEKVTWNLSTDDDKRHCEEFLFTPFDGHWGGPEGVPVQWRHGESSLVNQGEKLEEEQGCGRQWSELGKGSVMSDSSVINKLQTSPTFTPCYKELTEWQFGQLVNTQCAIYLHKEMSLQVIHRILTRTHFSHGKAEDQVIKPIRFQS